ncbi:hypothetical protein [Pseudomonas sp. Marseille-QA0892]
MANQEKSSAAEGERREQSAEHIDEDLKRLNEQGEQPRPEDDVAPDPNEQPDAGR